MNESHAAYDLIAAAQHEVRTPLTVIVGHLELLADTPGAIDPGYRDHIDKVIRNAGRLCAAVDDILQSVR